MLPINFHHLYYFWTAARLGSIAAATQELLVSQPALSLQIRLLENSLGKPLLVRGPRGVSLTLEGREAFAACERIFGEGNRLLARFKRDKEQEEAPLRLGVSLTVPRNLALGFLEATGKYNRRRQVTLFVGDDKDLMDRMRKRLMDLVVSHVDLSLLAKEDIQSHMAAQIPVWLVAKPNVKRAYTAARAGGGALPVLLRPVPNPVRRQVDQAFHDRGIHALIQAETEDADLLRLLALRGMGAAALTVDSVHDDIKSGRLAKMTSKPVATQQIWLIYRNPEIVGPLFGKNIRDIIQKH